MQAQLFTESLSEAIESAINQLGGMKKVGTMLWPEKSAREAGNHLSNCLNPDHSQKLSVEQIEFIIREARRNDIHDIHKYLCESNSYEFKPITKESIKADIQQQMNSNLSEIKTLIDRWEKLK